jgi:peptide/nickel transport system permease protein
MLILIFAVILGWLPAGGRGQTTEFWACGQLPDPRRAEAHDPAGDQPGAVQDGAGDPAGACRHARGDAQDYIKFARAKGLSHRRVVLVHVLKNIMIPVVTVLGLELGSMIAFAVVTETVFAWPGMGKLLIDSINLLTGR